MMSFIQQYIVDVNSIAGGVQLNLSYTTCLGLVWLGTVLIPRIFRKRETSQ